MQTSRIRVKFEELTRKLSRGASLKVGFLEGATYPDGTPVATIAAIQEFGAPNAPLGKIPPRPFFRNMVRENSKEWAPKIAQLLRAYQYDTEKTLQTMGLELQSQLKKSIADLYSPELSQVTLLLREWRSKDPDLKIGRMKVIEAIKAVKSGVRSNLSGTAAKPLIYSGHMLASVDFEVEAK